MSRDLMRYDLLAQEALRGVVRAALTRVAKEGLPGTHHFYITFATDHDGVEMPDGLRQQFPAEMTIVMQHQYWDLKVEEDAFEVSLSFNKLPHHLRIPFEAIRTFVDPSVQFMLQFQGSALAAGKAGTPTAEPGRPADGEPDEKGEKAGEVVSLDAFRKKQ
jgi:hypothetical protein